jgi:DMSO/TMAO reductase YedYZ heme-binding membrane subunit
MQKNSWFFLILLTAVALLATYQSFFPLPASISINRFLALAGFLLVCISLIIGPLATIWPKTFIPLMEPRRAIGITAFVFIVLHVLLSFLSTFNGRIDLILNTIPALIAIPALLIFLVLTLTSCDYAIKILGPKTWKGIQYFNYLAFVLSFAHFILQATGLFMPVNNTTFVNIAEVFAVLMGIATVILQFTGFLIRMNRKAVRTDEPPANVA